MHTIYSDGTDSVEILLEKTLEKGIKLASITDHDNIDGQEKAMKIAASTGLLYVSGVEINCRGPGMLDLLAYGFDVRHEDLSESFLSLIESRKARNSKILNRMKELGIRVTLEDLVKISREKSIGRPHFARLLVEKGHASSIEEAFRRFLNKGAEAYIEKDRPIPDIVLQTIRAAGGLPVLAHPLSLELPPEDLESKLKLMKRNGLEGIEVFYKEYNEETRKKLLEIAERLNLLPTGGSDYHGYNKPFLEPGVEVPNRFVEEFQQRVTGL